MLNKLILFIVLFLANLIANAQYIKLEKMNSLDKKTIQLPKKIKLVYQTDSLSFKQKVNVIDYHFPYVTVVKNKKDTLLLNVKNISYLKIGTPLRNPVLVLSTFITSVTTLAGLAGMADGDLSLMLLVIPSGYLTYKSVTKIGDRYNTKTKWSFY